MVTRRGIKKLKVEDGRPRGVCDICHKKDRTYKLTSRYRKYRFLSVCDECLTTIRSAFRKKRY